MKKIILVALLTLLCGSNFLACAFADWQEPFPLPSSVEELSSEEMQLMGGDFTVTVYTSDLSFKEIAKFYKEKLPQSGWEDVSKNEKVKQLASGGLFSSLLLFEKGEEFITIQNLPNLQAPRQTRFSLARGNPRFLKSDLEEAEPEPEPIELKDLPVYPAAVMEPFSSMRTQDRIQVGYTTPDSIEPVIQFYQEKLPVYGWEIDDELPVTEYGSPDLAQCAECKKIPASLQNELKDSAMRMQAFKVNKASQACIIGLSEFSSSGEAPETLISISCSRRRDEEKNK